jgi:hypothetical protein
MSLKPDESFINTLYMVKLLYIQGLTHWQMDVMLPVSTVPPCTQAFAVISQLIQVLHLLLLFQNETQNKKTYLLIKT